MKKKRSKIPKKPAYFSKTIAIHRRPCEAEYIEQLLMIPMTEQFKEHISEAAKDDGVIVNESLIEGASFGFIYALFLTHDTSGVKLEEDVPFD